LKDELLPTKNIQLLAGVMAALASGVAVCCATAPRHTAAAQPISKCSSTTAAESTPTKYPSIKYVVVIFQENVSFDHYFATYPWAANTDGTPFYARSDKPTPPVNNLSTNQLLEKNPNRAKPFRLSRSQAATCDQDHGYTDEQKMFDLGRMDRFVEFNNPLNKLYCPDYGQQDDLIMGYYDGNTVTAIWNYAQHFAMNDNSYNTTFGPSTPGVLNLIAGNTNGADIKNFPSARNDVVPDGSDGFTVIGDAEPSGDVCTSRENLSMKGKNIGDELNSKGVSWGFFQGGFDLTVRNSNGSSGCLRSHTSATDRLGVQPDYIPHHEGFQYFKSTRNLTHARPKSACSVGYANRANHQYDVHDFFDAIEAGNFPAVSFLKAWGYQDGHAGYSSPLDEQTFLVRTINFLMTRPEWDKTIIIVNWDDSDGWYDHQWSGKLNGKWIGIANPSDTDQDTELCGTDNTWFAVENASKVKGRCGYGPRLPYLVISPYAKENFVDNTLIDQSSTIGFIRENWNLTPMIDGSFADRAGAITNMLDFSATRQTSRLCLSPNTGAVKDCESQEPAPSN
jgi:phospholipase C